ncbi:hypothetical protein [Mycobacteroides chelonae]|uniref:hypothetical protein n=1 Tax=Mycobacteroides chelonae TaxID=1774 RepID=UPI000A8AFB3B|nr:hypothetical protein [Mycobacteroides chelonae]MBF9348580.1 hypothetical protein [Mycobacteroides chelonae]
MYSIGVLGAAVDACGADAIDALSASEALAVLARSEWCSVGSALLGWGWCLR